MHKLLIIHSRIDFLSSKRALYIYIYIYIKMHYQAPRAYWIRNNPLNYLSR